MSNIFLQPCNFEKIVRFIPQVTAMLPHQCELTLSPPTISKDQMPLSKILVPPQAMPSFGRAHQRHCFQWGGGVNHPLVPAQSKTCHSRMVLWSMKGSTETEDGVKFLRLLLAQAGVQYEDKRISQAEWKRLQPCKCLNNR